MYYAGSRRSSATGRRDPTCITRAHVGAVPRGGKTPRDLPQGSTPEGDFEVEMPWGGKTPREMPQGSTPGGNDIAKFREIQEAIERTCISMQRRLVGHILYRIEKAQKFLARCVYSEKGKLPAKYQRLIAWVNGYIIPWVRALSRLTDEPTLKKLAHWWELEGMPSEEKACNSPYAVYARLNLSTNDLYVGQTDSWQRRQLQHTYKTFRHSKHCASQCRHCGEHHK